MGRTCHHNTVYSPPIPGNEAAKKAQDALGRPARYVVNHAKSQKAYPKSLRKSWPGRTAWNHRGDSYGHVDYNGKNYVLVVFLDAGTFYHLDGEIEVSPGDVIGGYLSKVCHWGCGKYVAPHLRNVISIYEAL